MKRLPSTALAASVCIATWQPAAGAEDALWPGFMGTERNGWVASFDPPKKWPANLARVWNVEVGTGYGSPLVSGDRIFQHARLGEEEVVWCLDLKSGKTLWRKSSATPFKIGQGGQKHGKGPKSSPVLADGRLFTLSITGVLSAWEASSGNLLWHQDYRSEFGQNQPYWGVATSPIVDGERLVVYLGNDEKGALLAFDVKTGKELWRQGKDGTSYSSPLLVEIGSVSQIVQWNHEKLIGVDSKSGRLLWEHDAPHRSHNQNMPTPVFYGGRILLGGEHRGIRSLEPQLTNGSWTVLKNWHQKKVSLDMSTAVLNGDLLFGFSHHKIGQLFCLDAKTGEVRWLGPGRTGENVAFLSLPNHILALINTGELRVLAASGDRYQQVASYRLSKHETWAPPVIINNRLLIKDLNSLTLWALGD